MKENIQSKLTHHLYKLACYRYKITQFWWF